MICLKFDNKMKNTVLLEINYAIYMLIIYTIFYIIAITINLIFAQKIQKYSAPLNKIDELITSN
jgi:hypothetical protein